MDGFFEQAWLMYAEIGEYECNVSLKRCEEEEEDEDDREKENSSVSSCDNGSLNSPHITFKHASSPLVIDLPKYSPLSSLSFVSFSRHSFSFSASSPLPLR